MKTTYLVPYLEGRADFIHHSTHIDIIREETGLRNHFATEQISPKTTLALGDDKTKKGTTPTPKELFPIQYLVTDV